jgi:hypothetical protein
MPLTGSGMNPRLEETLGRTALQWIVLKFHDRTTDLREL